MYSFPFHKSEINHPHSLSPLPRTFFISFPFPFISLKIKEKNKNSCAPFSNCILSFLLSLLLKSSLHSYWIERFVDDDNNPRHNLHHNHDKPKPKPVISVFLVSSQCFLLLFSIFNNPLFYFSIVFLVGLKVSFVSCKKGQKKKKKERKILSFVAIISPLFFNYSSIIQSAKKEKSDHQSNMRPIQPPPSTPASPAPSASSSSSSNRNRSRRRPDLTLPLPQRDPRLAVPLPLPPTSAPSSLSSSSSSSSCFSPRPSFSELERINRIGRGMGGTVYKVLHRPTSKIYALKVINGNHEDAVRLQICREIEILRDVDNPNVVRCHDMNDHNGEIQILLEYMDKGSLEGIHIPHEPSLSDLTRQILSGLSYLHKRKIVHRDIKPSNLLINTERAVKIADFGVSRVLAQTMDPCNSSVGTIAYMSPERIDTDLNHGKYDGLAGDIWSFGVSILEFYLGRFPFAVGRQCDWATLMCAICMSEPPEAPRTASKEFRNFIACCLQRDPAKRWTAGQLLRHPFILQYSSPSSLTSSSSNNQNQVLHQTHQLLPPPRPHFSSA